MYPHTVLMGQRSDGFQFVGCINSTQFRTFRKINGPRLGMMLVGKAMQIGCDQLRSQFSVGSGDRTDLTTGHLHRRATFIHINVRSFGTKDRVVRTSHQLQGNDIAACSIENKQWLTIGYKRFFNFPDSFFCPQIVAIAQGMIPVSPCQGFHNGRMHTRIIIRGKTSHSVLKINYSAKEENYSQKKKGFHHRVPPKTVQE